MAFPEFPEDAFHDDKDGMYKVADPEQPSGDFVESGGLFVPKPAYKSIRILNFEHNHLEMQESAEFILSELDRAAADESVKWLTFHDPTFGAEIRVPRTILAKVSSVIEGWKDIDAVAEQIRQVENAKKMGRLAQHGIVPGAGGQPLPPFEAPNRRGRRG